jgi:methylenetetrahydrofolate reductase (NADPH)
MLSEPEGRPAREVSSDALVDMIARLLRTASIEINVQDVVHLAASEALLAPDMRVYVSHLPKQRWRDTTAACRAVREAGFEPVPHVPVRLLPDAATLDRALSALVGTAQIREALLIAGDYAQSLGPYGAVVDVLRSGMLEQHGLERISVAGHSEGHPTIALEQVRAAEREKVALAAHAGLGLTFLTQFFFEPAPFLAWVGDLRARGIDARVVAGLAGSAGLATLFKFATHCDVGPSIRALGARPSSFLRIAGERGPQRVIRGLARALAAGQTDFAGIHFFCFGGFLRTCQWLDRVANRHIILDAEGGFDISTSG